MSSKGITIYIKSCYNSSKALKDTEAGAEAKTEMEWMGLYLWTTLKAF